MPKKKFAKAVIVTRSQDPENPVCFEIDGAVIGRFRNTRVAQEFANNYAAKNEYKIEAFKSDPKKRGVMVASTTFPSTETDKPEASASPTRSAPSEADIESAKQENDDATASSEGGSAEKGAIASGRASLQRGESHPEFKGKAPRDDWD